MHALSSVFVDAVGRFHREHHEQDLISDSHSGVHLFSHVNVAFGSAFNFQGLKISLEFHEEPSTSSPAHAARSAAPRRGSKSAAGQRQSGRSQEVDGGQSDNALWMYSASLAAMTVVAAISVGVAVYVTRSRS